MADFTREEVVDIAHKLEGADLRELDLRNTSLQGLNLTGADLSRADLRLARYNEETRWPAGFDPVAAGAVLVDD
ncbi:MAG: pentapeptide repeat-containing protein [Gammaproteobacteria bacterium]|nr:pentapeptide repeat-containing protein [Gammaproteobacteria bacterium]